MTTSIVCRKCDVAFKSTELYEAHLRGDKSCSNPSGMAIELHYLHLIQPTHENQRRIVQLDLAIPMRIEMIASWHGGALRWALVSAISDASFPRES